MRSVKPRGDLDFVSAPRLRRQLESAAKHSPILVVDLSRVTFMDSTCIGEFVRARNHVVSRGGSVRIVNASPSIERSFRILGLLGLFDMARPDDHAGLLDA